LVWDPLASTRITSVTRGIAGLERRLENPPRGVAGLARLVDEELSRRLLPERVFFEKLVVQGVPAEEGEATVGEVAQRVARLSENLGHGVVVGVVYTSVGDEVWIIGRQGRIAVVVEGRKKLFGHEALNLYGNARGEYVIVLSRPGRP